MKTLKDFTTPVLKKELRQGAINRIKNCEVKIKNDLHGTAGGELDRERCMKGDRCKACKRFMEFFNITEKDLKK